MTRNDPSAVVRDLQTLLDSGGVGALSDGQLLERFVARRDPGGSAFAVLVGRHGSMVWGVCRRILDDPNDAADAFQATFLVLVQKAGSVRVDDSLGRWLHGVSLKVARRARSTAARRSAREGPGVEGVASRAQAPDRAELLAELDAEIGRLPERYRAVVVLCDLGNLSHEEAARQLGCAVGTVGSRLSRGRERLRGRLARRGLAPPPGPFGLGLSAKMAPSLALVDSTSNAALRLVAGDAASIPANVAALSKGMLPPMSLTGSKLVAGAALLATSGLIALSYARATTPKGLAPPSPTEAPAARAAETPQTPEAILARMIKTYADARSYEDEGEAVLVFKGEQPGRTVKRPFATKFVRPKLFRYEFSERTGDGEGDRNRYVIWTDAAPESAKTWWTIRPEVQENPLALAVGAAVGVSGGTSQEVPGLLMPKAISSRASLGWLKEAKLAGEEAVEKAPCYKIEGKNVVGQPETTWVDKETYLLKKTLSKIQIPGNTVEQTTTYRPKLNVEIPADQFAFDPPKP
jgi:RNA polymerase sigma factor (sigma-70 family)